MIDYRGVLGRHRSQGVPRRARWSWEEDGCTVTRTYNYSAPGCHDSCGVLLYTKDGKLEKVEGDPLDPYANGKLCMRCLDLDEMVNHPQRLKYPMRRAGERGENKWERISWDEALDMIDTYIKEEIDGKGLGRESILVGPWHGSQHQLAGPVHSRVRASGLRTWAVSTFRDGGATCPACAVPPAPWETILSSTRRRRCPSATPIARMGAALMCWWSGATSL